MSDIFDGGGVGATAAAGQLSGMLSEPPLSPAVERPEAPAAPAEPALPVPGLLERKLLQHGLVTMDQLGEAMREEAATGRPVAAILLERGWVAEEQIAQFVDPAPRLVEEPAPAPVAAVPPEPVPVPEPVYVEPAPVPTVAPPAPEPVQQLAPAPVPAAVPEPVGPSSLAFHLYIRLSTGERIDANTFSDLNEARLHAEDLVKKLASNSHVWPHFGGRYIRPDAIISIDVEAAPV